MPAAERSLKTLASYDAECTFARQRITPRAIAALCHPC
jgi:hypothetical protein